MNKSVIIVVIVAIVALLGVGAFVYEKKRDHFPVSYLPYVPSPDVIATTTVATSTLDYSRLEKDTIYTEEEGKYENLPPEGKKLLEALVGIPGCDIDSIDHVNCYNNNAHIRASSIVAVSNNRILYKGGRSDTGVTYFTIINTVKSTSTVLRLGLPGTSVRSREIVIIKNDTPTDFLYYKAGFDDFRKIPNTDILSTDESYYNSDAWGGHIEGKIEKNLLLLSVFKYTGKDAQEMNIYKKTRNEVFDLNLLK